MTDETTDDDAIVEVPAKKIPDDAPRDENGDPIFDDPEPQPDERRHNVNESHDKIRIGTDITRGEGTRDQEKHKLNVRGETPKEAAKNLSETLQELEDRNVFERARNVGGGVE